MTTVPPQFPLGGEGKNKENVNPKLPTAPAQTAEWSPTCKDFLSNPH